MDVARSVPQGDSLLPSGRYLLASLTGNDKGNKELMVLLVRPTLTRFPTNILYTPVDRGLTPMRTLFICFLNWE